MRTESSVVTVLVICPVQILTEVISSCIPSCYSRGLGGWLRISQKLEEARVEDDATERADDQSIERASGIQYAIRNPERNQK